MYYSRASWPYFLRYDLPGVFSKCSKCSIKSFISGLSEFTVSQAHVMVTSGNYSAYSSSEVYFCSIYAHMAQYSAKNARGILCRFLELFLYIIPSFPQIPDISAFLNTDICLLRAEIYLSSPSCCAIVQNVPPGKSQGKC